LIGGVPTAIPDAPVLAVFLVLFILGAIANMTILQLNLRRSHKFLASGALFGFCMARTVTCVMRVVWLTRPTSVPIAIAANVFVNAGIVIIIIINLIFTLRILRAQHPDLGWHRTAKWVFGAYLASIVLNLAMLITSIVQQVYTLDRHIRDIDHDLQVVGATYNTVAAFLPIPLVALSALAPRTNGRPTEKFGSGRFRTKLNIILLSSALLTLGAAFRAGTSYVVRPRSDPAWYHSKACFYVFNFTLEVIVVFLYVTARVDRRFHVPDGSNGPGEYARGPVSAEKHGSMPHFTTEEEFLDGAEDGDEQGSDRTEHGSDANLESKVEGKVENVSPA